MAEEKTKTMLDKIESLIVDGNREVLGKISQVETNLSRRIEALEDRQTRLEDRQTRLEDGQKEILEVIKKVDKKHDINAQALYDLLQDTKKDIKRVEDKLDAHMRQPAHASYG